MVRVQHPAFDTVVYEVPAEDLHEWLSAGWISLEPTTKQRRQRRPANADE